MALLIKQMITELDHLQTTKSQDRILDYSRESGCIESEMCSWTSCSRKKEIKGNLKSED